MVRRYGTQFKWGIAALSPMLRALNHNTSYVPHPISYPLFPSPPPHPPTPHIISYIISYHKSYHISYFQAKLPTKTLTLDMMDEIFVLADREDAPGGVAAGIHGTMGDTGDMGILGIWIYGDIGEAFESNSTPHNTV